MSWCEAMCMSRCELAVAGVSVSHIISKAGRITCAAIWQQEPIRSPRKGLSGDSRACDAALWRDASAPFQL